MPETPECTCQPKKLMWLDGNQTGKQDLSSDAKCELGPLVGVETCGDHGDDFDVADA